MDWKKITINYLHFHYVDKKKKLSELKSGRVTKISSDVQEVYAQHIAKIATRPKSSKSYPIFRDDSDQSKKTENEIKSMIRQPDPKILDKSAKEFVDKLLKKMRTRARPKSGVLFQIIFTFSGQRHICFLKLAWVDDSYGEYDESTASMTIKELIQALPTRGRFQKGAIYPHPTQSKSYMKVYQEDKEASYFENFLGGDPEVSGREMMKEIRRLAKSLAGTSLSLPQNIGLFQGLRDYLGQSTKSVKEVDVIRIIQHALPSIPLKKITDKVNKNLKVSGLINYTEVADLKLSFKVGGILLSGSFTNVEGNFIVDSKTSNTHKIKGKISKINLGSR